VLDLRLDVRVRRDLPEHHPYDQEVGGRQPGREDLGEHRLAGPGLAEQQQGPLHGVRGGQVAREILVQIDSQRPVVPPVLPVRPGGLAEPRHPEPMVDVRLTEGRNAQAVRDVTGSEHASREFGPVLARQRGPSFVRQASGTDVGDQAFQPGEARP
jgi:hypothetical protein